MKKLTKDTKICAGIVLYNPNEGRLSDNINAVISQVSVLFLVDNASNNIHSIRDRWIKNPKIRFITNNKNEGIAKALNQMCEAASLECYRWILTLDQDSVCPNNLIETFIPFTENNQIGIVCPRFKLNISNDLLTKNNNLEYVDYCITSASLTRLEAWKRSGKFDEWMFIDCVDYDFCIKLKNTGYKIIKVNDITINHEVGNAEIKCLPFNIKIILYNHNKIRNYYMVRNTIYIIRKYSNNKSVYKWIPRLLYWELCKIIFEKNKKATFMSLLQGLIDGLFSKI